MIWRCIFIKEYFSKIDYEKISYLLDLFSDIIIRIFPDKSFTLKLEIGGNQFCVFQK